MKRPDRRREERKTHPYGRVLTERDQDAPDDYKPEGSIPKDLGMEPRRVGMRLWQPTRDCCDGYAAQHECDKSRYSDRPCEANAVEELSVEDWVHHATFTGVRARHCMRVLTTDSPKPEPDIAIPRAVLLRLLKCVEMAARLG